MENNENKIGKKIVIGLIIIGIFFGIMYLFNSPSKQIQSSSDYTQTTLPSPNNKTTTNKKCMASPCPNNAVSGSSYCSIHKKGKTKKCAKCGIAIWDDETFCDNCLYGSIIKSKGK